MKILQVSLGVKASAGGPVRSITGLTKALSNTVGCEVYFFVHNPLGIERFELPNVTVIRGHRKDGHLDRSGDFERTLDLIKPDIVHFHGLWNVTLYSDEMACKKRGIPYILAPRGSLDAWSMNQKWLKKQLALLLFQRRGINCAAALHVTAPMEADHCRKVGYRGPFIISPNGIDLTIKLPPRTCGSKRRALFLSRMHPKKGVMELVEAWYTLKQKYLNVVSAWQCELVYTLNGVEEIEYESMVRSFVMEHGLMADFIWTGSLSDNSKWEAYRRADLFVLPTHTENFGIVIAEAMYAGLPVITTRNAPWQELESIHAGWWIELEHEQLVDAMATAMKASCQERLRMGDNGRRFIETRFNWQEIAKNMAKEYAKFIAQ